ncbi:MAG: hypothetical protein EOO96_01490 [Pedobacter sp.]|nr:MAG: hypothetical protein EOO96_01490 [Pedobacter sp.]
MKRYCFIIFSLFLVSSGCKKQVDSTKEVKSFTLNVPKKVGNATFTVTSIDDSRCPENANCISMGKVSVLLKVQSDFDLKTLQFCMGDCKDIGATDKILFPIANVKCEVKIIDVKPYPNLSTAVIPKTVTFEIKKG